MFNYLGYVFWQSLLFISVKSHHFSTVFQKVDGLCLRYAAVISHLCLYQFITDVSFVGSLIFKYLVWAIW